MRIYCIFVFIEINWAFIQPPTCKNTYTPNTSCGIISAVEKQNTLFCIIFGDYLKVTVELPKM